MEVEGVQAVCCTDAQNARNRVEQGLVAVLGDRRAPVFPRSNPVRWWMPFGQEKSGNRHHRRAGGDRRRSGFTAGVDCHAAVETKRGHTLPGAGRCIPVPR